MINFKFSATKLKKKNQISKVIEHPYDIYLIILDFCASFFVFLKFTIGINFLRDVAENEVQFRKHYKIHKDQTLEHSTTKSSKKLHNLNSADLCHQSCILITVQQIINSNNKIIKPGKLCKEILFRK